MSTVLSRFTGAAGRRRLVAALSRQPIVQGSKDIATALAEKCNLQTVLAGAVLIEQGGPDNDLFFVLAGSFAILVNGREVARRSAEQHVGEMAMLDAKARRSATVVAREDSVVARITESNFDYIASTTPTLWKNIACILADRLRQRNDLVRQRNDVPHVFVGSSRESLPIANVVQTGLAHDPFLVTVWTNGVFGPSQFAIEALERAAVESDFAILVLGPDDVVTSRRHRNRAPRDNVILELGLFIGAAGHDRIFLLVPSGLDIKIPTDLLGVTPVMYSPDDTVDLTLRLTTPCTELRTAITRMGPR